MEEWIPNFNYKYWITCLILYVFIINLVGFITVGMDKNKARKKLWRVPEKTFFYISALGGSLGVYAGLFYFRHKTKHWYFMTGVPAILIVQIAIIVYLFIIK